MAAPHFILLASLGALLAGPGPDLLESTQTPSTTIERSFQSLRRVELRTVELARGGTWQDLDALEIGLRADFERQWVVRDDVDADAKRVQTLERAELQRSLHASGALAATGGTTEMESDRVGKPLPSPSDTLDLDFLLPQGPVAAGDTWVVPRERLADLLQPARGLDLYASAPATPDAKYAALFDLGSLSADFDGSIRLSYAGSSQLEEALVGAIAIEIVGGGTHKVEVPALTEGSPSATASLDYDVELSGTCRWDLESDRLLSLNLDGTSYYTVEMLPAPADADPQRVSAMLFQFEGTESLRAKVQAR